MNSYCEIHFFHDKKIELVLVTDEKNKFYIPDSNENLEGEIEKLHISRDKLDPDITKNDTPQNKYRNDDQNDNETQDNLESLVGQDMPLENPIIRNQSTKYTTLNNDLSDNTSDITNYTTLNNDLSDNTIDITSLEKEQISTPVLNNDSQDENKQNLKNTHYTKFNNIQNLSGIANGIRHFSSRIRGRHRELYLNRVILSGGKDGLFILTLPWIKYLICFISRGLNCLNLKIVSKIEEFLLNLYSSAWIFNRRQIGEELSIDDGYNDMESRLYISSFIRDINELFIGVVQ